jgi:hypothetical protein
MNKSSWKEKYAAVGARDLEGARCCFSGRSILIASKAEAAEVDPIENLVRLVGRTAGTGGERAYWGHLGQDRSPRGSRHCICEREIMGGGH